MIRVRLPGGYATATQFRALAALARDHGNGLIDLTNRGNLQIRGLHDVSAATLRRYLGSADLLPANIALDRIRNIAADPFAGLDGAEIVDTAPVVKALDAALQSAPALRHLIPEFEFVIDNGGRSGVGGLPYDVALVAEKCDNAPRFRLFIAGKPTGLTVAPANAAKLAAAAARTAVEIALENRSRRLAGIVAAMPRLNWLPAIFGPYENRFRRLIARIGIDDIVTRISDRAGGLRVDDANVGQTAPRRLSPSIGAVSQCQNGLSSCGLGVPVGRLDAGLVEILAGLSQNHGDGTLRLAPWHAVFIPNVPARRAGAVLDQGRKSGFVTDPSFIRARLFACSGVAGCRGGKFDTKTNARAVAAAIAEIAPSADGAPVSVHLSGCIKGCARRQESDVFALERTGGYAVYRNCRPGAAPSADLHLADVPVDDLPEFVARLVADRAGAFDRKDYSAASTSFMR